MFMDLALRVWVDVLIAKFEDATHVSRTLASEGLDYVPSIQAIIDLDNKFGEFGTVSDLPKSGRAKIADEKSTNPNRLLLLKEIGGAHIEQLI